MRLSTRGPKAWTNYAAKPWSQTWDDSKPTNQAAAVAVVSIWLLIAVAVALVVYGRFQQ